MEEETGAMDPNLGHRNGYLHSASYDLFILALTIFSLLVAVGLFLLPLKPAADAIQNRNRCLLVVFCHHDDRGLRRPGSSDAYGSSTGSLIDDVRDRTIRCANQLRCFQSCQVAG